MGKLPYSASIHRSSCPSPAKRDCPECRSPMEASVSCRGQDTPASEEEQQRRPNRARRLLVDAVRQRARRRRPVRRLRFSDARSPRRGMCDSNSRDHDGGSGRPGAGTRPTRACPAVTGDYRRFSRPGPNQAPPSPIGGSRATPRKQPRSSSYQASRRWRDPDSNRGHHDFQSCHRQPRTVSQSLETMGSWPVDPATGTSQFAVFCRQFGR
jgi:hypothetical protein